MSDIETRLDRLESLVDDQQDRIEQQQSTIEAQQETIDSQRERLETLAEADTDSPSVPISRRRALQAGGALGLLGLGTGTASAAGSGQIGNSDIPVDTIYTDTINGGITGGSDISSLVGWGLEIYGPGNLRVDWDAASGLSGSGVADRVSATEELNISVDNDTAAGNIVAGYSFNAVDTSFGGVIAGGGAQDSINKIEAGADYATIGGGLDNTASGASATIPGGDSNTAAGDYSFAVGQAADAQNNGAFVVGDSTTTPFSSTRADQARFQMNVGADAIEFLTPRGAPDATELDPGEGMLYVDDGSVNFAGDLVYSYNDSGSIVTVRAAMLPQ